MFVFTNANATGNGTGNATANRWFAHSTPRFTPGLSSFAVSTKFRGGAFGTVLFRYDITRLPVAAKLVLRLLACPEQVV